MVGCWWAGSLLGGFVFEFSVYAGLLTGGVIGGAVSDLGASAVIKGLKGQEVVVIALLFTKKERLYLLC
jgi:hypothetical protein